MVYELCVLLTRVIFGVLKAKSDRVIFKTTCIFVLCVYVRCLTISGQKGMSYLNHSIICVKVTIVYLFPDPHYLMPVWMTFHQESSRVRIRNNQAFVPFSFWLVPEIFNSSASHFLSSCQACRPHPFRFPYSWTQESHPHRSTHAIRPFRAALTTVLVCFFAAFRTTTQRRYRNHLLLSAQNSTGPCNLVVPFKNPPRMFFTR